MGTKVRGRTEKVTSGGQCVAGTGRCGGLASGQEMRRQGRDVKPAGRRCGRKTHGYQCVNPDFTPTHPLSPPPTPTSLGARLS